MEKNYLEDRTDVYKIKKKMMNYKGYEIEEI